MLRASASTSARYSNSRVRHFHGFRKGMSLGQTWHQDRHVGESSSLSLETPPESIDASRLEMVTIIPAPSDPSTMGYRLCRNRIYDQRLLESKFRGH